MSDFAPVESVVSQKGFMLFCSRPAICSKCHPTSDEQPTCSAQSMMMNWSADKKIVQYINGVELQTLLSVDADRKYSTWVQQSKQQRCNTVSLAGVVCKSPSSPLEDG